MKADGIVNFGTDLDNPSFAEVACAIGLYGIWVEHPSELDAALRAAFSHDGPAVVEVMTVRHEVEIPPGSADRDTSYHVCYVCHVCHVCSAARQLGSSAARLRITM